MCALVGVLIKRFYEMHGSTMKILDIKIVLVLLPRLSAAQFASMWHNVIFVLSTVFRVLISDTDISHLQRTNKFR